MARNKTDQKLQFIHSSVKPEHAEFINQIAEQEQRPIAQVVRLLIEDAITRRLAIRSKQPIPETPVQAWSSFS